MLIVADFASEYGIRLGSIGNALPWIEFRDLLIGLLSDDTRVSRQYARRPDKKPGTDADHETERGDR